jgi:triacylglycerol lipase
MAKQALNPVILVHGITDRNFVFREMAAYLAERGWLVHSLNLCPNNGQERLENLAYQVGNYIKQVFPPQQPIDLLGFSMGGLVTRYYLQKLGGCDRAQRYISISTPHHGTLMAYLLPYQGVQQMRPGSAFLRELNQSYQQELAGVKCTNIWTPLDLMIIPARSSDLGLGKTFIVSVPLHAWMIKDRKVFNLVQEALQEPALTLPRTR